VSLQKRPIVSVRISQAQELAHGRRTVGTTGGFSPSNYYVGLTGTARVERLNTHMTENRRAPRLRTLKGGSIIFGVAPAVNCVIRNMSETGAQLIVESPIGIPDDFTLLIKPELIKRACRVAWRKADRIGVRFI